MQVDDFLQVHKAPGLAQPHTHSTPEILHSEIKSGLSEMLKLNMNSVFFVK